MAASKLANNRATRTRWSPGRPAMPSASATPKVSSPSGRTSAISFRVSAVKQAAYAGAAQLGGRNRRQSAALARSDDQRSHDRRRLAQALVRDLRNGEPGVRYRPERGTIRVAAVTDSNLQALQPVLPAREPRLVGEHVLEEHEAPAGPKQAMDLG